MSLGLHKDKVKLVAYDPEWTWFYKKEEELLKTILTGGNLVKIYHIGSTNIPFIMSKPVMGILATVKDFPKAREWTETLDQAGYILRQDEAYHLLFTKGPEDNQILSLKIAQADNHYAKAPLLFDKYLKANPKVAKEYEALKISLARKYPNDRQKYTIAKNPFIRRVLKQAEESETSPRLGPKTNVLAAKKWSEL